jgi:predicted CXXCH cytochrome family protein
MGRLNAFKAATVTLWVMVGMIWAASSSLSQPADQDPSKIPPSKAAPAQDYVGSETCKTCHEQQFDNFSRTAHARLADISYWRDRVHGCESCHGPGRAHVEGGGDVTKIRTFKNEPPKQVSETCLTCHSGKEEHNNYRRGEHWRNDVSCIDCHSPHSPPPTPTRAESLTFIAQGSRLGPDSSTIRMLRLREPYLCLRCHNEMKSQFTMPFHHKVLEGTIRCSDCHNPHGGFESKQTRLAIGADAPCIKCHTDKQGPFVYEHAPLKVEGCAICHDPHGSSNPRLLRRTEVRQLCLECHSNAHTIGAPNTPSFHNQATVRFRNCTTCHVRIHGSNVSNVFFR